MRVPPLAAHVLTHLYAAHYGLSSPYNYAHSATGLKPDDRAGAYELIRLLGAGGMGQVWLASEARLGRKVALKFLPDDLTRDPARVARFEREARSASALNHPTVCHIYSVGETADGVQFIAMELIEGETLRERLRRSPVATREVLDVCIQIGSALAAAHAAGIVHRDLKPENVMVRADGLVKVLDFGLAKLAAGGLPVDESQATRTLVKTDAGVVMGTYTYMAPEQARAQEVDARADIWALGVILYELVSGRVPFTGDTRSDVLASILDRDPAPLDKLNPAIPHELQRIVAKALRKDRAQRYQTITDLRLDLEVLRSELQGSTAAAAPVAVPAAPSATTPQPVRRESSAEYILTGLARHKLAAATGLLVIAALAAGAVWRTRRGTPDGSAGVATRVQRNLTRLTFGGGLQTDPTLSPDGRFLAYASDRAGNFDIWVQSISGGEPVQVTKSPFQDTQPDWSPDGSTLVFRSERDGGGLFLVPALGGAEQRLTSFGVHPQWITSGSEIMFIESSYGPAESASGSDAKIYVTSPGREQPAEILSDFVQKGAWFWIAGHPDGRVSLYGSHRDHGLGFFTTSRDGSKLVASEYASEVSDLLKTQNLGVRRFQWNRSGTALYVEAYTSGIRNLWRVEVDPRTLRWLSAQRLTTSGSNEGAITLSRDGTRLAFTMQGGATRLWAFTLDPTGGRLIDKGKPITADDTEVNDFDLSRDGRIVAHVLARPGREGTDLWTSEIGSGKSELIAKNAGLPRWSFDGNRLAYVAFPRSGAPLTSANAFRLVVRDQTSRERTIARRHDGIPPAIPSDWLPDDNAILASWNPSAASGWALTIWPTSKLAERPGRILLADTRTSLWQGRFSPNGRWLSAVAVSLDNPGRSTLVLVPAAGASAGQWLRIAGDHEWPDKPRWSSDGRTLYFISRRPTSFFNLWAVRFDPAIGKPVGQPFMLTHFDSPSRVISPNLDRTEMGVAARHAVLSMQNVTGNVWMLDNVDK